MTTPSLERPLSPHLQVYRLPLTALTSISHRITGVALSLGTLLLISWLWAVAYDGEYYALWQSVASHWAAKLVMIGWTFAVFYHLGNGIRHLFWDVGRGFDISNATRSGLMVILFAFAMTFAVWCALFQHISFL